MRTTIAIAVVAGLLVLCCNSQAGPRDDRAPAARPDSRGPATRAETNRRGESARKSKVADIDRPSMPIPIPGVGFSEYSKGSPQKTSSGRRKDA